MNDDDGNISVEGTGRTERRGSYSFRCDDESLISGLVEAVAWVKGVEPTELDPLYDVVDTEALERLYRPAAEKRPRVSFSYAGCDVQIEPDTTVTVHPSPGAFADGLSRPSNVLVFDTSTPQYNDEACSELLTVEPYSDENLLRVTFDDEAGSRARGLRPDTRPANLGVLSVGDFTRSTATSSGLADGPGRVQAATVPDADDLAAIGIHIGEFLAAWAENDHRTVVCFDSLDDLLARTDLARAFGFLYLLTKRVMAGDAVAHYHLDATAHDDRTVATLEPLFDDCIEHNQVDGWTSWST